MSSVSVERTQTKPAIIHVDFARYLVIAMTRQHAKHTVWEADAIIGLPQNFIRLQKLLRKPFGSEELL